ncbi:MAG: hypothetical protein QXJ20_02905 [Candidatus Aenigmatarchaeota archaeon]
MARVKLDPKHEPELRKAKPKKIITDEELEKKPIQEKLKILIDRLLTDIITGKEEDVGTLLIKKEAARVALDYLKIMKEDTFMGMGLEELENLESFDILERQEDEEA